jgi:hypothetical protein
VERVSFQYVVTEDNDIDRPWSSLKQCIYQELELSRRVGLRRGECQDHKRRAISGLLQPVTANYRTARVFQLTVEIEVFLPNWLEKLEFRKVSPSLSEGATSDSEFRQGDL